LLESCCNTQEYSFGISRLGPDFLFKSNSPHHNVGNV
jgi:hypothetical protein